MDKRFRLLTLFMALVVALALALSGCGEANEEQEEDNVEYEIAMVTDAGLIMNGGYSEVAWNTISDFGASQGVSHKYYKASEATEEAYESTIDTAVSKGAKVVVADGYPFQQVVYDAQEKYPDVKFILIDAQPVDESTGETKIGDNTVDIIFNSAQLGYLAGYSAVREGYRELGFLGGGDNSIVTDYGYGFLQGAELAANKEGTYVNVRYKMAQSADDRETIQQIASDWYDDGTEVIMACGSNVEQPVIEAAELLDREVIACETEKSEMSDVILTSAVKDMNTALTTALKQYKKDEFPGGTTVVYDAYNDGISLELANGHFSSFNKSQYNDVFTDLKDGTITVKTHDAAGTDKLGLNRVKVIK
jgi:basic membrane protein A